MITLLSREGDSLITIVIPVTSKLPREVKLAGELMKWILIEYVEPLGKRFTYTASPEDLLVVKSYFITNQVTKALQ